MVSKKEIKQKIKSILESIPGVLGFETIIENKKKEDHIYIMENDNKIDISLGLIINRNISTKTVANEIYESLQYKFKAGKKFTLNKLNLYIKGVK